MARKSGDGMSRDTMRLVGAAVTAALVIAVIMFLVIN